MEPKRRVIVSVPPSKRMGDYSANFVGDGFDAARIECAELKRQERRIKKLAR